MRISLFSGPGSGKSTIATRLFSDLKVKGHSIELVSEYIKKWAYQKRVPKSADQCYIFGQQLHAEDLVFQSGVCHLVTDSPLLMQPYYGRTSPYYEELLGIAKKYEKNYPSLNIFLNRTGIPYQIRGRYETADEAVQRDVEMLDYLKENNVEYAVFKTVEYDKILNFVETHL